MKLFFYGGTFDPPHFGHYNIVKKCLKECDKLIIIPNKKSVNKVASSANFFHRVNMLKVLFESLNVHIDDFENKTNMKNYTFYTVKYLLNKYKDADVTMVIGEDQALDFYNWYRKDDILKLVEVCCFSRNIKSRIDDRMFNFRKVSDFNYNISSTKLRHVLKENNFEEAQKYIQNDVLSYIKNNNLYA